MVVDFLTYRYSENSRFYLMLSVFVMILLANIVTLAHWSNLIITIPQVLIVFAYLFRNDIPNAALLHFSFFVLSLSAQGTLGMMDGQSFSVYNYGTMKLAGPIRLSYVINIFLVVACYLKFEIRKDILFYKLFVYLCCIGLAGLLIGVLGFLFGSYYTFEGMLDPVVYMFVTTSTCYILLCLSSPNFIKSCYYIAIISTIAGIISSFLSFILFNVSSSYSIYDIVYTADSMAYFGILIVGFIFIKQRLCMIITMGLLAYIEIMSLGGKGVVALGFAFLCLVYLVFFDKKIEGNYGGYLKYIKPIIIVVGIIGATNFSLSGESMAVYKINSAASMFAGDMEEMSRSPYIRVASLVDIIYEGLQEPLFLLFGHGYGGYFQDVLGLFEGIDLTDAWSDEVVASKRFYTGHDTMVTVPLFNGLLGLFIICKITYLYVKKIPYNFLSTVAFFWVFLMFYFNTIYAVTGLVFLMGAEYDVYGEMNGELDKESV